MMKSFIDNLLQQQVVDKSRQLQPQHFDEDVKIMSERKAIEYQE